MQKGICLFTTILFFAFPSFSAEREAETIIVTADRIQQDIRTTPQSMLIIDQDVLAAHQYEDLADLLQNYGLQIMSYGPNQTSSQITIRGMSSDYSNPLESNIQILVNGAPIATTNLAMLPLDGIEKIEILKGPGAVQYGSSAIGGVVNIIPRTGTPDFHLNAEAGGGTWNAYRALGSLTGQLNLFDFAGAISWDTQKDNYTTGDGKLYDDTNIASRLHYLLNMGLNFNEENRLGLIILGANDTKLGLNNSLYLEELYKGLGTRVDRVNSAVDLNYTGGYSPSGLTWNFKFFNAYNQDETKYNDPNSDYIIDTSQTGGSGQISWNWDFLTITGGIDYTENKYESGSNPRYKRDDLGAFAMIKLSFWEQFLNISAGFRHDYYIFRVNNRERDLNNTSFNAGASINPFEWLTIRASYGESFKVPSGLAVVGYESTMFGVIGNPNLKPERGYGWDAGLDIHWKGLKINLDYFSTIYNDKILSKYTSSNKSKYYNVNGSAYYNGIEGYISFDLGEFFDWDFALKPYFNFTGLFNYNDATGKRLYNVRNFTASWGLNFYHPAWGTTLDARLNYIGYQQEQAWLGNDYIGDRLTGNKLTADIFLTQRLYEFKDGGKISLKGEVRNLTNENYAYRYDYPMPGRSFYVGVRYDY